MRGGLQECLRLEERPVGHAQPQQHLVVARGGILVQRTDGLEVQLEPLGIERVVDLHHLMSIDSRAALVVPGGARIRRRGTPSRAPASAPTARSCAHRRSANRCLGARRRRPRRSHRAPELPPSNASPRACRTGSSAGPCRPAPDIPPPADDPRAAGNPRSTAAYPRRNHETRRCTPRARARR